MKPVKCKGYTAYLIVWDDSYRLTNGTWHNTEDSLENGLDDMYINSIGYLMKETKNRIMVVSDIAESQNSQPFVIPKCSIKKMVKLYTTK